MKSRLAADGNGRDCERNRHDVLGKTRSLEGSLHVRQRGVLHEAVLQFAVPDAVIDLRDFDIADLEFHKALFEQRRVGLPKRRPDELQRSVQTKGRSGRRGRNHESAARNAVHDPLPSLLCFKLLPMKPVLRISRRRGQDKLPLSRTCDARNQLSGAPCFFWLGQSE